MKQTIKEKIENKYGKYFNETIKLRGLNYYENDKVISCFKYQNKYFALIEGSYNEEYKIQIEFKKHELKMSCTCPCEFNCKHEFATLLAILNHNYKNVSLKPKITRKTQTLKTTINKIPATELKQYFLNQNTLNINTKKFEQYFSKYLPNQSYKYYYNNLYNALIIQRNYKEMIYQYIIDIQNQINNNNYSESFNIIKSIINTLKDTHNLDNTTITNTYPLLQILLRITYRKAYKNLKQSINTWMNYIQKNNYYDSLYLEDLILTVKRSV